MRGPQWMDNGMSHIWLPYTQMKTVLPPLPAVRTSGCDIHLADGRVLTDGIASWWTACHGYNHPHIRDAVSTQLSRMPHVMFGGLVHEPALTLATRLARMLPGDLERVFFTDSGSVAVEVAIKIAIQYWINRGVSGRNRLLAFRGGYHGDTLATMAVCDPEEGMHALFNGVLPQHYIMDLPRDRMTLQRLESCLLESGDEIAAILVEPLIQGAGGMLFHDPVVLRHLRTLADRYGILLIFDEIFTGFGRTGTMFACQQADVVPDIMTLSKALTAGTMPLAATVTRTHVFEAFLSDNPLHALMHGPTFMANPLACACANASLDLFETQPRLEQVRQIGAQMAHELAACRHLPNVRDVRVMGAVGVVELETIADMNRLKAALIALGVWIRPFRTIIYLTPSFTIRPNELSRLTDAIRRVIAQGAAS
ncbi:adenosylmethionine--8-amino-7-oxononanoate transaminase [Novacetimonas pomaceti]|uniref:adenosylmethionine--8-amino-7-oxononanoate transaminase n=1 Tax=Novacetimonas pomaceti TaxID=2021998 RepID=UPI001C2D4589|nr:adenosylmethionine--8-amino-7-oxononanoate transaminase [Novacetimonas pomaceti]MBV1832457.1 adenosylmethionine--8-amino-7-oxononanoate transaminase [Novacetimonas pomaceti]